MAVVIRTLASYLVRYWGAIPGWIQWTIKQLFSSAIVYAIQQGYYATVNFLSHLSSTVVLKVAKLLGLA